MMDAKTPKVNWSKIANNLLHLAVLGGSAYLAMHPEYAAFAPAVQAVGQMLQTPDFSVR